MTNSFLLIKIFIGYVKKTGVLDTFAKGFVLNKP